MNGSEEHGSQFILLSRVRWNISLSRNSCMRRRYEGFQRKKLFTTVGIARLRLLSSARVIPSCLGVWTLFPKRTCRRLPIIPVICARHLLDWFSFRGCFYFKESSAVNCLKHLFKGSNYSSHVNMGAHKKIQGPMYPQWATFFPYGQLFGANQEPPWGPDLLMAHG